MEQILNIIILYSLGFGLILALLTGLMLLLTRSASPLLRYRILVGLLSLFSFSLLVTGYLSFKSIKVSAEAEYKSSIPVSLQGEVLAAPAISGTNNLLVISRTFLENNARTIAIIWLLVVLMKSIKLGSHLVELYYLKTRQLFPAGKHWEEEVARLAVQIGLRKTVKIMQSGLTRVPLVIGHFKPIILIPLGMITAIRPQEIELMLLHELAHIKRVDFLVNILQHVLEVLFFFNPAVLWVSSLIRRERENCCDEMAMQNADGKQSYIQALLSFREYQLKVPTCAMAFAKQSSLINRVRRIAYQKNITLNAMEKGCLVVAVLLVCSIGMLRATGIEDAKYQKPKAAKSLTKQQTDTTRKNPKARLRPVKLVEKKETSVNQALAKPLTSIDLTLKNTLTDSTLNGLSTQLSSAISLAVNTALDSSLHYMSKINTTVDSSAFYTTNLNANAQVNLNTKLNYNTKVELETKTGARPNPLVNLNPQTRLNAKPLSRINAKPSGFADRLFEALERAGINTKGKSFNFHISNHELTVNGEKQPDKVLKEVLKDYLKTDKDTIDFTYGRN